MDLLRVSHRSAHISTYLEIFLLSEFVGKNLTIFPPSRGKRRPGIVTPAFRCHILPTMKLCRIPLAVAFCAGALALVSCAKAPAPLSRTEFVLGTSCTVTLYDHEAGATMDACFARLHEIDRRMSVNAPGSEIDEVNNEAGRRPVQVTPDVFSVMKRALALASLSGGLFDPTVGPLVKLWGINTDHARLPSPAEIVEARKLIDWHDVALDESAGSIYLKRAGMKIDLGGVAKGFAADEIVGLLSARGVRSALIDLGGNVFAMGSKIDGSSWRIGIQNPDSPRGTYFGIATVVNKTLVTSGVYERFFIKDGKRYHHIMDTRTGYPVDNGLESVTVITDKSFDADGVTLTLFSLGPALGLEMGSKVGVDVIMVSADHRVYATAGARKVFTITDPQFKLAAN
jgi:FAD:protein FMN transferase